MRKLLLMVLTMAVVSVGTTGEIAQAKPSGCYKVHQGINFYRNATHSWQMKLGYPITKSSKQKIGSCAYARWVALLWQKRAHTWRAKYEEYQSWLRRMNNPIEAIKYVFGSYAGQAIAVSRCETGGTFSVYASNGQYLGLFQMGSSERSIYGHGSHPLDQARAAYRYFVASGRDWSPWECKPW